jgi:ABC-2 type transport system permease protein
MLKLIQNENMKIYRRIGTWVMLGILVVIVLIGAILLKKAPDTAANSNWKSVLMQENVHLDSVTGMLKADATKQIAINLYRIKHNIPPVQDKSLLGFLNNSINYILVITFFVIIIGASSIANEFVSGTIKLLLIRPVKRWKILLSKYIATLLYALAMLAFLFIISFIVGSIFFGLEGVSQPYLAYTNGVVKEFNMISHLFIQYGYACVKLIMMVTFAFMISSVFRNSAFAIGTSIVLLLMGGVILHAFSQYDWVKYILFANMDLTRYIDGTPVRSEMTMAFSIIVLIVYFVIFQIISWTAFIKRDVAG